MTRCIAVTGIVGQGFLVVLGYLDTLANMTEIDVNNTRAVVGDAVDWGWWSV